MKRTQQFITSLFVMLCCCTGAWATGELNGLFTINASGDKVQFSQGNLQATYNGSAWSWAFATNQWDYIGGANNKINGNGTVSANGTVDLFGWVGASSSWTGAAMYGISNSTATNAENGYGTVADEALKSDWGNTIGAGWRTLSSNEWKYILSDRASGSTVNDISNARYTHATINTDGTSVNGIILFPDGVTIANDEATSWGSVNGNSAWGTRCTSAQWAALAAKGCVFLPAAGMRDGASVSNTQSVGYYQSSSPTTTNVNFAWSWYFSSDYLSKPYCNRRNYAYSVRLVKDYQLQQDTEGNYLIGSVQDWKAFAGIVNNTNPAANAKMTADIDLGDDQTTIGSGNTNAEYANVVFKGVFDGNGHTLTVNYNTSEGFYAPIRHISGATIKNLHVTGSIVSSGGRVGGIVCGVFGGSLIHSKIEKCRSSVVITSNCQVPVSDAECVGGIVGQVGFTSKLSLEDCIFDGEITGHVSNVIWSGLVGVLDGTVNTTRCLQAGSFNDLNNGTTANSATIVCRWQNAATSIVTMDATYYIHSFKTVQATDEQLSDGTITAALQASRAEEVWVQDPVTNLPMLKIFANAAYTVPSSGIGTFSAKAKFAVPDGLTAHYCKAYDKEKGTISVVAIEGAVPANTGVILKGEPGETYTLTGTNSEAASVTDNALVAVTEATHVDATSGDYTNFMMSGGKFIKIATSDESVKMPANKAYLQILTSALPSDPTQARDIVLSWDEEDPTGINEVRGKKEDVRGEIYNLSGQRVSKPTKGLYIIGGKKVFLP